MTDSSATRLSGESDIELMQRARDGDVEAFQELFRRHSEPLLRFIHRFVGTQHTAEDLTQEVFLRLYQARERYQPLASFKSYLYRIATNLCLNENRRQISARLEPFDNWPEDREDRGLRQFADRSMPAAEDQLAGWETAARVRVALDALPGNQRLALLLSRCDGFSCKEVADTLEISESAVKSLVFRATRTLREVLGDLLEQQPSAVERDAGGEAGRVGVGLRASPRKTVGLEVQRSA